MVRTQLRRLPGEPLTLAWEKATWLWAWIALVFDWRTGALRQVHAAELERRFYLIYHTVGSPREPSGSYPGREAGNSEKLSASSGGNTSPDYNVFGTATA